MANIIVSLIILFILSLSIYKIVLEKQKGMKCVGCPLSGNCTPNKKFSPKQPENNIAKPYLKTEKIPINIISPE